MNSPRTKLLISAVALLLLVLVLVKRYAAHDSDYIPMGPPTTTTGGPVPAKALQMPHRVIHMHGVPGRPAAEWVGPDGKPAEPPK